MLDNPVRNGRGYAVRPVSPGDRCHRLVAVEFTRVGRRNPAWICRCDCGRAAVVIEWNFRKGFVQSCGCYRSERSRALGKSSAKHNKTHSRAWEIWRHMRERCEKPQHKSWSVYGGRGIRVCDRWQEFAAFYADMGDPPTYRHTLDRINPDGNYEPGNCRWATWTEQANNRRNTRWLTAFGETKTITDWLSDPRCAVDRSTLAHRIESGWGHEIAIAGPLRTRGADFTARQAHAEAEFIAQGAEQREQI